MSSAGDQARRPVWLVRVPHGNSTAAGAGVLLDQHHVVTCAHVVAQQLGEPASTAGTGRRPDDVVTVEFPFSGDSPARRSARVVEWQPIADDQSGDAAILRLTEPIELTPAPLAFPMHVQDHRFSVHGFPGGDNAARQANGRLGGASGATGEWVQLDAASGVGWAVEHGFSGAPVFDHDAGAVVGIVVMTDAHRGGHMLPITTLRSWWPGLLKRPTDNASWQAHWLPRARGSERQSDTGDWYFTGRVAARQRICDWLADPAQPALVVTGGPGTGKSALLAHMLVCADPAWADVVPTIGPRPPVEAFDVAVHASGLTCEDVVESVAAAVGLDITSPPELLAAMRHRHQTAEIPLVIMVDAVEEAVSIEDARRIAVLLRNLAGTGAVRVLAGVRTAPTGTQRAAILGAFGTSIPHLPLETREFQRNEDVADYVHNRLTHEDIRGYYRDQPLGVLRKISWAIARKAGYNFLIAQLTTLWLTQATTSPLDFARPDWERRLPETVGEAMEVYLRHCGSDPELVRRILTALAFARGNGLSVGRTWLVISDALHPAHIHTLADVETVFHSAAHYLLERTDVRNDQPTYRLYHHALDEHLRDYCVRYTPQQHPLRAVTRGLLDAIPSSKHGRDWASADIYTRVHLAGHAAEAHQLDDVLNDPSFLVYAEPGPLLNALAHTRAEQGQLTAAVYRLSEHQHRRTDPVDRCRILAVDAGRLGAHGIQRRLNAIQDRLTGGDRFGLRAGFATARTLPTATIATLTSHTCSVLAVAVGELDGRPIALTGGGGVGVLLWDLTEQRLVGQLFAGDKHSVRAVAMGELDGRPIAIACSARNGAWVWDLAEQRLVDTPLTGHTDSVRAVAVGELDGRPIAITCSEWDGAWVWDLAEQRLVGTPLTGHTGSVNAVAVGELGGRSIAVTGGSDTTVRVWDLAEQRAVGTPLTGHTGSVNAVAVGELDGRPIAVTSSDDKTVRVWDLAEQRAVGTPLTGHSNSVVAVAVGELDGLPIAVTGSSDTTVRVWDLAERRVVGTPLAGHTGTVNAVAVGELDGRPIAVTGAWKAVRVWDLAEQRAVGTPLTGHSNSVLAVAVGELNGRPIAVTGGSDMTVRVWDLAEQRTVGKPLTGHTGPVTAVAVGELDGRPIAVTGAWKAVRVWDLAEQRAVGKPLTGDTNLVAAVAVGELDGRPIAVTGSSHSDSTVWVWDLAEQRAVGKPLTGHTNSVVAVAVGELDGLPIAVTGSRDTTVRVWDLAAHGAVGTPLTGHTGRVNAVAVGELDGRPIAVTGSDDKTVRIWDLRDRRCLGELAIPTPVQGISFGACGMLVVRYDSDIVAFELSAPMTAGGVLTLSSPCPPRRDMSSFLAHENPHDDGRF